MRAWDKAAERSKHCEWITTVMENAVDNFIVAAVGFLLPYSKEELLGNKRNEPARVLDVEEDSQITEPCTSFLYKKKIGNGKHTSFWYDQWSDLGQLYDVLGDQRVIDLGIHRQATVEAFWF